jgi:hypothetical protein
MEPIDEADIVRICTPLIKLPRYDSNKNTKQATVDLISVACSERAG